MTRLMTTVAAAALLALPALAQAPTTGTAPNANQGKPPSPAAESTQKAPEATKPSDMTQKPAATSPSADTAAKLSTGDRNFIETAASSGKAEVEMGKLAVEKARNPQVKDFAKMMVEDHGKVNDKLMAWAKQNKAELPKELKPEHKRSQTTLSGLSDAQLDRAYMDTMVQQHQKAVQLFTQQSTAGQNPELKQFAADTLPTVQQHLKMAQQITADLNKTAATDRPAAGDKAAAKPTARAKSADKTTLEQGSTDRDVRATEPAAGGKRKAAAQRSDPESARVAELNRQQLQRMQGQQPQR
jgi:putative membrane protein